MKKYQMYNYWNDIRDERAQMNWQEFCNRAKAKEFENKYAVRINTLCDDILTIQKKYIEHDEEGGQIRKDNAPVFHEGMTEEMLNAEFKALMDQDITEKYADLKFVFTPKEVIANETEPATETGEKGNTETDQVETGTGSRTEKQESPATA